MTKLKLIRISTVFVLALAFIQSAYAQTGRVSRAEAEKRADALLAQMTLDEKLTLIGGVNDFYTQAIPRLGIPQFRMSDGPLGVHDYGATTAYPATIALAASWDTDLAKRVGEMLGKDARARSVHFILAPGMNIYRAPMNGRNFEYLGEDEVGVYLESNWSNRRIVSRAVVGYFSARSRKLPESPS